MNLLTVDFETYYSKELGFKTHTTEAYIRHDDFHVIGVAVAVNDGPAQWFSGTHEQIKVWFNQFDWGNSVVLAHNTVFDGAILSWKFGINPMAWLDTLSMARAVHGVDAGGSLKALAERYRLGVKGTEVENALGLRRVDFSPEQLARYGEYCCNDAELTRDLFQVLAQTFPKYELRVIDATLRMFIQPRLILDAAVLTQHLHEVREKKAQLLAAAAADRDVLMSNDKFAELLIKLGVEPPSKISARTGKKAWAFAKTDEAFKALLDHDDPRVQVLVSARLGTKTTLEETRTQRLLDIAARGPLPVPLRYYGARTGRWSADGSINMQNLPRKSTIKKAITAPEGYVILGADLSNIELRVGLRIAGQMDKLQLLADGQDLYKDFASSVFGVGYDEVTDEQRFIGKTSQLSLIFGVGAMRIRAAIKTGSGKDIGDEMSEHIVGFYRTDYAKVQKAWSSGTEVLSAIAADRFMRYGHGGMFPVEGSAGIRLPSGLFLQYPGLRREPESPVAWGAQWTYAIRGGRDSIYGAKVFQGLTQATARVIMAEHLLAIKKQYPVVLTIHDALYMLVPEDEAERAQRFVVKTMRTAPVWLPDIPLDAEAGYAKTLSIKMSKHPVITEDV
jgi:DNA polymerase I-like protein with 3'-5' exonuclease and polymerase domains